VLVAGGYGEGADDADGARMVDAMKDWGFLIWVAIMQLGFITECGTAEIAAAVRESHGGCR
jgi:hypothetical protein